MARIGNKTIAVAVLVAVLAGLVLAQPPRYGRDREDRWQRSGQRWQNNSPDFGPRQGRAYRQGWDGPEDPARGHRRARANQPAQRRGQNRGMFMINALYRLDLNEQQQEQVKEILDKAKENAEASRESIAEARKALRQLVTEGAEESAIRDAATALGKALGDQAVAQASVVASVKKVLTEEQLTQFKEMIEKAKEIRAGVGNGQFAPPRMAPDSDRPARQGRGQRQGRRAPNADWQW